MSDTRTDVYSRITQQIEAAIEAGAGDWRMPWHHNGLSTARPINLTSNKPCRGVNVLVLWVAAQSCGYIHGLWGTYRQWLAAGAQVRRGERGATVVLWKQAAGGSNDRDEGSEERPGRRVFARAFTVFNVAQVDGYAVSAQNPRDEPERFAHADGFIANLGVRTIHGGDEAYYLPVKDEVHLPLLYQFDDAAAYYGTAIHEYGHSDGSPAPPRPRSDRALRL